MWRSPGLWLVAVGVVGRAAVAQEPVGPPPPPRLRDVRVETRDVFSAADADANLLFRVANWLHATTDEAVIWREIWLRPGDPIDADQAAEVARNLRRLGLFGAVGTDLVPVGEDEVDLAVRTRDRFSLTAAVGLSRVGGVTELRGRLAESNLLGTGKQVVLVDNEHDDEFTRYVRFTDPQLFGSWHTLETKIGATEEGDFANLDVERPLRHLADPWTYGGSWHYAQDTVDYRQLGESTAEIPREEHQLRAFLGRASGPRELRQTIGLDARVRDSDYAPAIGIDAARWRVPGDTTAIELGPTWAFDYLPRFDCVQHLDTLDYLQDLPLGVSANLRVAGSWRDEAGAGADLRPLLDAGLRAAANLLPDTYATVEVQGRARFSASRLLGWRSSAALHLFQSSLPAQTLAASLALEAASEREDLPVQLTLGEDNGLRGYPAFEFGGTRFVRCNLEDRIDTGLELWHVHLGVVAFCDIGWVHDPVLGLSQYTPMRSVGCGLRLGSTHLFGARVLRVDLAWPLDDAAGQSYGASLSFATGQVFSFFGSASELGVEF